MKINFKAIFGNQMLVFKFQNMAIPKAPTAGICSRIPHTLEYVPFLDYEPIIADPRLQDELMELQHVFRLGDWHVMKTAEFGRHAICIDRMLPVELLEVMYASSCDYLFKRGIRINEFRTPVLRCYEKGERDRPKYIYTVESPFNGERLQSQAHGLFLKRHYGVPVRLTNPDGNTLLTFQDYKTSSKVRLKDVQKEAKMVQRS